MSMEGDPIAIWVLTPFVAAIVAARSRGLKPSWYWALALGLGCLPLVVFTWARGSMDVQQEVSTTLGFVVIPTCAVFLIARLAPLRARPLLAFVIGLAAYFVVCIAALSVLVTLEIVRP